jgi:hypothetical protein
MTVECQNNVKITVKMTVKVLSNGNNILAGHILD